MSKYTTEVRYICEEAAGLTESVGFNSINSILSDETLDKIFDFFFPIFDEAYRHPLERKILKHYYTREIGQETVGLWKLRMETKLNEIMPYYNKLYESELLEFNPLYDVNYKVDHKGKGSHTDARTENRMMNETGSQTQAASSNENSKDNTKGNTSNTTAGNTNSTDIMSDTPQGGLNGVFGVGDAQYATTARNNQQQNNSVNATNTNTTNDNETQRTSNAINADTRKNEELANVGSVGSTTDDYIREVVGKQGSQSFSSMIVEFRKTFLKIDEMLIKDLSPLFFGLW